jgi:hypothetical protein
MQDLRLQRAIQWVGQRLEEQPKADRSRLLNDAEVTYGLSPFQAEFLCHTFCPAARAAQEG